MTSDETKPNLLSEESTPQEPKRKTVAFNKPYLTGKEMEYIAQAVQSGKISGDGIFTAKCHLFFRNRYGFVSNLLTTSCTDALEMTSILVGIQPGDEVICPSYTFVSSANAFVLRGAKIIFADSLATHPNLDPSKIEALITPRTKVIVVVHYAGVAVDMDPIMELARKYRLAVVEDAAQAIESFYRGKPLGGIGHFGTLSFHETKNVTAGEGGLLIVNDKSYAKRAEIIREKGTNRSSFFRGEIDKYGWVDVGSSFLPSDLIAAFLWAQLENIDRIQKRRISLWERYYNQLKPLEEFNVQLPLVPEYASNNAHCFYLVCESLEKRTRFITKLKELGIHSVFHYLPLHESPFYSKYHDGRELKQADRYANGLVRLPLYCDLKEDEVDWICSEVLQIFK
jgi:dTDP-4-amino-4,6-dideoxygalactose transaminase